MPDGLVNHGGTGNGGERDDEPLRLAPLDPETEAVRRLVDESEWQRPAVDVVEEPARYQFSLRQLLIVNTVLAVVFALIQALAPSLVAGALGVIVLATAVLLSMYPPDNPALHLVWWGMLGLYLLLCLLAVVRG